MAKVREKLHHLSNSIACHIINHRQKRYPIEPGKGCLTIFHDYESDYAICNKADASRYGVRRLLEIEQKVGIRTTYNVVGKLLDDVPDIIQMIVSSGHDIGGHSYRHDTMTEMNRRELDNDIKKAKKKFQQYGIELNGIRSPQSRWNFKQIKVMHNNSLVWSAENDKANFPYTLYSKSGRDIVRLPISMDDWDYISKGISPNRMYINLMEVVRRISNEKSYGSIGFHPWVQGEVSERLDVVEEIMATIRNMPDLRVITFWDAYQIYKKQRETPSE